MLNRHKRAVSGARTLLLGVAYKRNSSDLRESPAMVVIERLASLGAEVRYADDQVAEADLEGLEVRACRVDATSEEVASADAIVVLTDHDDVDYEMVTSTARYVLDTRRCCRGDVVEHL